MSNIASYSQVKANKLRRHYKKHSSGYQDWDQKDHAKDYMIFADNLGEYLSIDELALSQGELYTFLTNKNGKGKAGTLVAMIKGTLSSDIIKVLKKLPIEERNKVKEVTLDMARNMATSVRSCFTNAKLVVDRFHVVKLAIDALQHLRVKQRWLELDKENQAIELAKKQGLKYKPIVLSNGDTPKQLLARCRYILAKQEAKWTDNQQERAQILFDRYPIIKKAYKHIIKFRNIFEGHDQIGAKTNFKDWIKDTFQLKIKEFNTVANAVQYNIDNICHFFENRNTNANAESFNSKIKLFRANLRGVTNPTFFLFRLKNIFA